MTLDASHPIRVEAHIDPARSRWLVSGMTLTGGGFVLLGLMTSEPLLVLISLVAFSIALYNYPLLREHEPVIVASATGLEIDALGFLDWKHVSSLQLSESKSSQRSQQTMVLELDGPLNEVIRHSDEDNALRNLQVRIWRHEPPSSLIVNLGTLRGDTAELYSKIEPFYLRRNSTS